MYNEVRTALQPNLSSSATISDAAPTRWSTYKAPKPFLTVRVGTEEDIAIVIKFCNSRDLPFLAQNGGSGWVAFPQTQNLVLIDLAQLNTVHVSENKEVATVGGGVRIHEAIAAADAAGVLIQTGNCNSAGLLGSLLGGGYGNLMGQYGFGVDNILEMRVVTADGVLREISASKERDLFWAMKGAGPNFGIVTSAVIKVHAMPDNERTAWCGALIFSEDKLERVVEAIEKLELEAKSVIFMYFASSGPPSHSPAIVVTPWLFQGTEETGKIFFKSLYDIGPVVENMSVKPYNDWNTGANPFCTQSERKPSFGASLDKLDPSAWRDAFNVYCDFQKQPTAEASVVLCEVYPMNDMRFAGENSASFCHRGIRANAVVIPWYRDADLDGEATKCGNEVRQILRRSSSLENKNSIYVNFAHGDETPEEIYGDSLRKLRELKRVWDPKNRFGQWYNIV